MGAPLLALGGVLPVLLGGALLVGDGVVVGAGGVEGAAVRAPSPDDGAGRTGATLSPLPSGTRLLGASAAGVSTTGTGRVLGAAPGTESVSAGACGVVRCGATVA